MPHAYKIALVPDLSQLSIATGRETVGFFGSVQIDIEVLQAVEQITVNANDISFARATVEAPKARSKSTDKVKSQGAAAADAGCRPSQRWRSNIPERS